MERWQAAPATDRVAWLLAAALMVLVGFVYLTSGLVVPAAWLVPLWLLWIGLAWWTLRLRYQRVALLIPLLGIALWFGYLTLGDRLLGWTA